jgi:twinkle protein
MILKPSSFDLKKYLSAPANDIQAAAPTQFKQQLVDLFYGERKDEGGRMPWIKTHSILQFRCGEVTMWAGINGHGKSQVTTQVALDMAYTGEKVAIGSFEMSPERTLHRMVRQASRSDCPPIPYISGFLQWFDGSMWLLDKKGTVSADYVIAAIRYCAAEYGVTQFFVDNMAKCVKGEEDWHTDPYPRCPPYP